MSSINRVSFCMSISPFPVGFRLFADCFSRARVALNKCFGRFKLYLCEFEYPAVEASESFPMCTRKGGFATIINNMKAANLCFRVGELTFQFISVYFRESNCAILTSRTISLVAFIISLAFCIR